MRKHFSRMLLLLGLLAVPNAAWAQDSSWGFEPPQTQFVGPFSHRNYSSAGIYTGLDFLYFKQTNPLYNQVIGYRGFMDIDGSITGQARNFVGSADHALTTGQLRGPTSATPGMTLVLGYKFDSDVKVAGYWTHLTDVRYSASASTIGRGFFVGDKLENTFLFAPVVNFTPDWAGQPFNVGAGNPGATYGIWNAATTMQIQFLQRFDMGGIDVDIPIWKTESYRSLARIGPRAVTMWERFWWRTVDASISGDSAPVDVGKYSNIVSNRLYGVHAGCENDWYLGDTPVGAFSATLGFDAALYMDFVKMRAAWDRGDRVVGAHRSRRSSTIVPGFEMKAGLQWYPWEAIQVGIGYDVMVFFNTISSRYPVDFDMGTIDPQYRSGTTRWLDGVTASINFVF